jgi:hypothetical protein
MAKPKGSVKPFIVFVSFAARTGRGNKAKVQEKRKISITMPPSLKVLVFQFFILSPYWSKLSCFSNIESKRWSR